MASTRFPMRAEHYSMSLSDASEIFQTAKVTQIFEDRGALFFGHRSDQPHDHEEGHHRRHEVGVGDFPGPAVMAGRAFLDLLDDDRPQRLGTSALAAHAATPCFGASFFLPFR